MIANGKANQVILTKLGKMEIPDLSGVEAVQMGERSIKGHRRRRSATRVRGGGLRIRAGGDRCAQCAHDEQRGDPGMHLRFHDSPISERP
jgi:hypothetical protein